MPCNNLSTTKKVLWQFLPFHSKLCRIAIMVIAVKVGLLTTMANEKVLLLIHAFLKLFNSMHRFCNAFNSLSLRNIRLYVCILCAGLRFYNLIIILPVSQTWQWTKSISWIDNVTGGKENKLSFRWALCGHWKSMAKGTTILLPTYIHSLSYWHFNSCRIHQTWNLFKRK